MRSVYIMLIFKEHGGNKQNTLAIVLNVIRFYVYCATFVFVNNCYISDDIYK